MSLFIQELAAELAAAEETGMKPDLSEYREPEAGEEVAGSVSSPALQAIIAVIDDRTRKFSERWPSKPDNETERRAALVAMLDLKVVKDVMWNEVRRTFSLNLANTPSIGLRKNSDGLLVVKCAEELEPRVIAVDISMPVSLADILGGDCGNPDCPIHHPKHSD